MMTLTSTLPPAVSRLGRVTQIGFVPHDYDAALAFWTQTMGVGPFFEIMHFDLSNVRHRGNKTQLDISAGLAYWNDLQIELIRQHDSSPSIYQEWLAAGRSGINHIGIQVSDFAAAVATIEKLGGTAVQEMSIEGISKAKYYEFAPDTPMVEIYAFEGDVFDRLWAHMHRSAQTWDGTAPVRGIPDMSELPAI